MASVAVVASDPNDLREEDEKGRRVELGAWPYFGIANCECYTTKYFAPG
jgi:hypothetical protein